MGPFAAPELGALLGEAGRFTWAAGPRTKGAGLCHGTGGNGYAFLKLYQRTNDPIWLDRARQFAMTAIVQYRADEIVRRCADRQPKAERQRQWPVALRQRDGQDQAVPQCRRRRLTSGHRAPRARAVAGAGRQDPRVDGARRPGHRAAG